MSDWNKFLLTMTIAFMAVCAWMYWLTTGASAWSIPEAHVQANTTLVEVGDFCSGTVIDKKRGYVATANHCAETLARFHAVKVTRKDGAEFVNKWTTYIHTTVTQRTFDSFGKEMGHISYEVEVAAVDKIGDTAILRNISGVPFTNEVKMSDKPLSFGDVVYAVGNPLMFPGVITVGYVMQPLVHVPFALIPVIMHTADHDHGSSGGGLFNDRGEMVGLTNWSVHEPGSYEHFASPVENLIKLLATMDQNPKTDRIASVQ